MRKILFRDLFREIGRSFPRFISIAILIALGSSFFIGLKSAPLNILAAADNYFTEHTYFDISLQTTDRYTIADCEAFAAVEDVADVQQKYITQGITKEKDLVIEIESYADKQIELVAGRLPEKVDEVAIDSKGQQYFGLGDRLHILDNEKQQHEALAEGQFIVVGFIDSYRYLDKNIRGYSTIGSGKLALFAVTLEEAFALEEYNSIDLQLSAETRSEAIYSQSYLDKLATATEKITEVGDQRLAQRKDELLLEMETDENELRDSEAQVATNLTEVRDTIQQLQETAQQLPWLAEETNLQITEAQQQETALAEQQQEITDSLQTLADSKEALADITYQITPIDETVSFSTYKAIIERLNGLGNVLPIIFFFVAGLVTVMIITRMIQQERKQIGTLKALGLEKGYILQKYRLYSLLSGILGTGLGIFFGAKVLAPLLVSMYASLYVITDYQNTYYGELLAVVVLLSFLSIVLIPSWAYRKTISETPLRLMRGQAPSKGAKIWLERLTFFWQRLPFNGKMNLRNIFRYKYRMLLLFAGIAGCTALLIISFGTRSSVGQLIETQFGRILSYDANISLKDDHSQDEWDSYQNYLAKKDWQQVLTRQDQVQLQHQEITAEVTIVSPTEEDQAALNQLIAFNDSQTKEALTFQNGDVFITQKSAELLGLAAGAEVTVQTSDNRLEKITVTQIVENYFLDYLYIAADVYAASSEIKESSTLVSLVQGTLTAKDQEAIIQLPVSNTLQLVTDNVQSAVEVTSQLDHLLLVVLIASATLGLVVVYNLVYINALERNQELAVLRVMGYTTFQITVHIFRELLLLGGLAIACGCGLGFIGLRLVIKQIELDSFCFPAVATLTVLLATTLVLCLITCLLFLLMTHKMKEINIVGALKARD